MVKPSLLCELTVTPFPHTPVLQLFSQGAFGYVLPIISFILAWIETWFLDFKVLPQEAEEENSKLFPFQSPRLAHTIL